MINIDFYIKNLRWLYIVFILTFVLLLVRLSSFHYTQEKLGIFRANSWSMGTDLFCATLSSAILILFVGGYADRISAKSLSTLVIFGLIVFVFLMANNTLHGD